MSVEKSASTAPALVPVAISGRPDPGDQAKAADLGISLRRTMTLSNGLDSRSSCEDVVKKVRNAQCKIEVQEVEFVSRHQSVIS